MSERAAIFMFCDEITDKSLDNSMQQLKSLGRYINPKNNGTKCLENCFGYPHSNKERR